MQPTRNIHINPKFKQVHINPNFLSKSQNASKTEVMMVEYTKPKNIHINPNFLPKPKPTVDNGPPIIQKTRRKIVRQVLIPEKKLATLVPAPKTITSTNNLIKIGRNKLIRIKPKTVITVRKSLDRILVNNKYKLIRKPVVKSEQTGIICGIVKKYFICRPSVVNENLIPEKVIITDRKLLRIGTSVRKATSSAPSSYRNKKLEFLNINGVLYKSTNNKLEKSNSVKPAAESSLNSLITNANLKPINIAKPLNQNRVLFVRGEKFLLESNGKSLKRLKDSLNNGVAKDSIKEFKRKRLDIGGLTYLAKSTGDAVTFEQTNYHQTRYHLNLAKTKSINVLAKKYTKTNIPCPIYKRLGKCLSYERGRCPRVHDRKHVIICKRFLKGECEIEKCLLSHDVNLSKMPTCKFYLQGCCTKQKCPYLHKKLNENVSICDEFLKGFCSLADKCPKRHELPPSPSSNKNETHKSIKDVQKSSSWLQKQGSCLENEFIHKKFKQKDMHPARTGACETEQTMVVEDANVRYFEQNKKTTVESSDEVKIDSDGDCVIEIKEDFTTTKVLPSYIPF